MEPATPAIWLAPLRGVTLAPFLRLLAERFGGVDAALAPFADRAGAPPAPASTRIGRSPRRETAPSAARRSAASTVPETVFPSRLLAW